MRVFNAAIGRCTDAVNCLVRTADKADIASLLPNVGRQHNLLELSQALAKIGFDTDGRRETWESLRTRSSTMYCPSLRGQIILWSSRVSAENGDEVYLFDGAGRRTTRSGKAFRKAWSGAILCVRRRQDTTALPAFIGYHEKSAPRIQFDTLFVDKGEVPLLGKPTAFAYPFRNIGTQDLTVTDVVTTCTCVKHEAPTTPIPPGGTGVVTLFYQPTAKQRLFNYSAVVETNDPLFPDIILNAAGNAGAGGQCGARPSRPW